MHDNEVTYSFICPIDFLRKGESIITSYKEISSAIIEGFKNIMVNTAHPLHGFAPVFSCNYIKSATNKKPLSVFRQGSLKHNPYETINAWSTADAYGPYGDRPSYAQRYGHHE